MTLPKGETTQAERPFTFGWGVFCYYPCMTTFTPPTDNYVNWALPGDRGIFAVLKPGARGRNIFRLNDGSFTEFQPASYDDIAHIYHGGHIHTIDSTEEAQLRAAGYGDYIEA